MVDQHEVAVALVAGDHACQDDGAWGGGVDGIAGDTVDVDPGVVAGPAEGAGDGAGVRPGELGGVHVGAGDLGHVLAVEGVRGLDGLDGDGRRRLR